MTSHNVRIALILAIVLAFTTPAFAGSITGQVTDPSGGTLARATVRLVNLATGRTEATATDDEGRFSFPDLEAGPYRVLVSAQGFADASHSVVLAAADATSSLAVGLELGTFRADLTVTAARGDRDLQVLPIRAEVLDAHSLEHLTAPSTGDILVSAPGVTPVGSGPFQMRPRLRGLDSTRVLVLVDGERLNNARTATDRAGVEVGLVSPDAIEQLEVLGGAGSVLYGTDALSGTVNIITNQPQFTPERRYQMGFDGLYSSNENGRRGAVSLGVSDTRWAVSFIGGGERYDDYSAGSAFRETTVPYFANGTIVRAVTIVDEFPDPFNAPFVRETAVVPRSGMEASSANAAARVQLAPSQELLVKYQRRHASNIGFPDFEPPYFFQTITLPWSRFDKVSGTYSAVDLTPWLTRLSATAYFQRQDRLLRNQFPVQFPVPGGPATLSVFRLDIESNTRQQVDTPGLDVQATFLTRPNNVVTAGVTVFRDRSEDERTTQDTASILGQITFGQFGPSATVFPQPVVLGPGEPDHPVRVPDASFRDIGLYLQDEWEVSPDLRLIGGVRLDAYRVSTEATPGYDVESLVDGAAPPIDPATLPSIDGDRISRTAFTGEAGLVAWSSRPVSVFGHYVRSYRHPNLEELLFSGPATTGAIVPNTQVKPETGHNVDVGIRVQSARVAGSAGYFVNTYDSFISTEVVAESDGDPISQAINFSKVRIQGLEAEVDVPVAAGGLFWSPFADLALTRGTVLEGANPLTGERLDGKPQDNITPWKLSTGLRVSDRAERWWATYSLRSQGEVTRVSPLLSESPFLIAQDLLALDGFTVQRLAGGYTWTQGRQRLALTVSLDNLANTFYREHFQFAPARGRSFSVAVSVRGVN